MLVLLLTMQEMLTLIGGLLVVYFVYIIVTQRDDNATIDAKSAVYAAIRKLVDHAVDEVQRLPGLENSSTANGFGDAHQDFSLSRKSRENLLATVIVNKVIAKCQSEQAANGNVLNSSEAVDNNFFRASETRPVDGQSQSCDRSLELLPKHLQAISVASKFTQTHPAELSSLMYEERIEEVAAYVSEKYIANDSYDELDFCDSHRVPFPELGIDIINHCSDLPEDESVDRSYAKTRSLPHSWKENWYFRKRSSDDTKPAVSMFVPNSSAEYRALIGDRDVDDTSDLSEYSSHSDNDEVETDLPLLTIKRSVDDDNAECSNSAGAQSSDASAAKSIGAGRNEDKLFRDSLAENTTDENFNSNFPARRSSSRGSRAEIPGSLMGFREDGENEITPKEDQRDRDCSEHNTLVPRRRCNGVHDRVNYSVSPSDASSSSEKPQEKIDGEIHGEENGAIAREEDSSKREDDLIDDFNLFAPPIPGSIADREHKKWQNAVPIENNPYSPENIQKRLVRRKYSPVLSTALPTSYSDAAINGNGFHALGDDDRPTERAKDAEEGISKNKDDADNNEPLRNDRDAATSECNDEPIDSKVYVEHRTKNGLTNTQLIRSYFENGEDKQDTRDVSPKKSRSSRKKAPRRQDSFEAKARNKNPKSLEATPPISEHDEDDKIALPSVKKIVQAFNEKIQEKSLANGSTPRKARNKSESEKEQVETARSRTADTRRAPRQSHLHSLTARSLSREFREGLRQVPKKA